MDIPPGCFTPWSFPSGRDLSAIVEPDGDECDGRVHPGAHAITNSRCMHVCRDILRIRARRFATIFLAQKFPPTTQIAEKTKQNGAAREINNSSPNEDIVVQLITLGSLSCC